MARTSKAGYRLRWLYRVEDVGVRTSKAGYRLRWLYRVEDVGVRLSSKTAWLKGCHLGLEVRVNGLQKVGGGEVLVLLDLTRGHVEDAQRQILRHLP